MSVVGVEQAGARSHAAVRLVPRRGADIPGEGAAPGQRSTTTGRSAAPLLLDDLQAAAVAHRAGEGPLVVIGAAGAGTTTVLIEAVAARVGRDGVPADGVLVLAPTRTAAADLRDRLSARLAGTVREPLARTPHSYAFGLLRRARVADGDPPPRLISGAEQDRVLADLLAGHREGHGRPPSWPPALDDEVRGLRGFRDEVRDLVMRAIERGLTPDDLLALSAEHDRPDWRAAAQLMGEYLDVTALATPGAYDPAGIVDAAVALLETDPELLDAERRRWALVAVDDAQELTVAGGRLLELLGAGGKDVLLVGDPDQATQTFRGARPRWLAEAASRFRNGTGAPARVIALRTGHRQSPELHAITRRVVSRIGSSGATAHRSAVPAAQLPPGRAAVAVLGSAAQEAAYVAAHLRRRHLDDAVPWSSMAVVTRSTASTAPLRRALAAAGVPVAVPQAEVPLRDEAAVVPLRLALRCVLADDDHRAEALTPDVAVELLTGPIGGSDTLGVRRLRQRLRAEELASGGGRASDALLVEALLDPSRLAALPPAMTLAARRLAAVLDAGRAAASEPGASAETVLWALWQATGLADAWRATALAGGPSGERADRDLDAVVALFEAAARFVDRLPRSGPADFLDYLEGQDVPQDTLAPRAPSADAVALVTAQGAAGREWDVVAVVGVQDGVWPDLRLRSSLLGAQLLADVVDGRHALGAGATTAQRRAVLEDETRLFGVAVSRARRDLLVTAVRSEDLQPSAFLDLVDPYADDVRPLAAVPRAMTLPGLVADLRACVADPARRDADRDAAARQLARLAAAGVPGADPGDWYGLGEPSTDRPLREDGAPVKVSPSRVEAFARCQLRWLLESCGGTSGPSTLQALGVLVHDVARELPEASRPELVARLQERLPELGLGPGWTSDVARARAEDMVRKFADYVVKARKEGRTLVAVEQPVDVVVGRARIRGQIDRVESDGRGNLVVVDLKTGRTPPPRADLPRHPQLGVYQAAVEAGALDDVAPAAGAGPRSGGAMLVQLGTKTKSVGVQQQPALGDDDDPQWAAKLVAETAEGMAGSRFQAVANESCERCPQRRSCPLQPEGRQVTT
ncbi:MAG: ATP-dependent DNA helicase [Kineosporiaceae bacterium]